MERVRKGQEDGDHTAAPVARKTDRLNGVRAAALQLTTNFKGRRIEMKWKTASPKYIERAMTLSKTDAERVFARMRGKLVRRMDTERLQSLEAVAIQLRFEDKQLKKWRDGLDGLSRRTKQESESISSKRRDA